MSCNTGMAHALLMHHGRLAGGNVHREQKLSCHGGWPAVPAASKQASLHKRVATVEFVRLRRCKRCCAAASAEVTGRKLLGFTIPRDVNGVPLDKAGVAAKEAAAAGAGAPGVYEPVRQHCLSSQLMHATEVECCIDVTAEACATGRLM
jgi:hypothetical protein